jgi:thiol-disulfide isomerase/thioredoxin
MVRSPTTRSTHLLLAGVGVLLAIVVALAVVAAISFGEHPGSPATQAQVPPALARGARAPGFTLPRLGGGSPVSLAADANRPVVINFFASWCPDCKSELHAFSVAWRDLRDRVSFLAIDTNDSDPAAAERLLAAAGDAYPAGLDPHASVAQQYLVPGLPMTVFLDRAGRVVNVALGAQSTAQLEHWAAVAEGR